MSPVAFVLAGVLVLAAAWTGPLPAMTRESYAAHMVLHLTVVTVGAPLLALGLAPGMRPFGSGFTPLLAIGTLGEFVVVWGWHLPALHEAAREGRFAFVLEQTSFLVVSLLVWISALAGPPLAGAAALFMTSMHMALLGVLIALAPRHLHGGDVGALPDQQLGGVLMTAVAGTVYVAAGLALVAGVLRPTGARR